MENSNEKMKHYVRSWNIWNTYVRSSSLISCLFFNNEQILKMTKI